MKTSIATFTAIVGLVASAVMLGLAPPAVGEALPGMCNGRSDANVVLTAHANGRPSSVPKYILNLSTDGVGHPNGTLILGRGDTRLIVEDWCRLWQHIPGTPMGGHCEGETGSADGATIAHAVGFGSLRSGQDVFVRTDVRGVEEGLSFRVRYRAQGSGEMGATEGEGCDDGSWTKVPAEGWALLDQLRVVVDPAP
jgi:hypothetical protein